MHINKYFWWWNCVLNVNHINADYTHQWYVTKWNSLKYKIVFYKRIRQKKINFKIAFPPNITQTHFLLLLLLLWNADENSAIICFWLICPSPSPSNANATERERDLAGYLCVGTGMFRWCLSLPGSFTFWLCARWLYTIYKRNFNDKNSCYKPKCNFTKIKK